MWLLEGTVHLVNDERVDLRFSTRLGELGRRLRVLATVGRVYLEEGKKRLERPCDKVSKSGTTRRGHKSIGRGSHCSTGRLQVLLEISVEAL